MTPVSLHPRRRNTLVWRTGILTFIITVFGILALLASPNLVSSSSNLHSPRYAVVIILDGSRPDYFNLTQMPALQALMKRGTTYSDAFVGQELANTPPSHATIGTGEFPKHHGVEGFLWEDPRTRRAFNPTEIGAIESGALDRVIKQHHVPSIASRVTAAYPHATVAAVAAHKCYASDALATPAASFILCALIYHNRWVAAAVTNHRPPPGAIGNPTWDVPIPPRTAGFAPAVEQWNKGVENDWTMRYALWLFHRVHYPRVLMMNLAETDVLGHFAPNTSTARYLMKEFDTLLSRIVSGYRSAGLLGQTDFVITADHGMSRIRSFMPYSVLTKAITEAGTTSVYIEHDTAASIGLQDPKKGRAVAVNIARLGGVNVDAALYKTYAHKHWAYAVAAARRSVSRSLQSAYVQLADTMASAAGPDVFAIYAPRISTRTTMAYGYPWRAGHLGPQWDDQHIPLIIAGPGVKYGYRSTYPARLVDIAPTLEYLLGARSGGLDGIVLQDALQRSTASGRAVQGEREHVLAPIVRLLKQRSGYQ